MPMMRIPAVFMRGGTSKAVIFRASDLPADRALWDDIFLSVMGVPDPYGRQLDGMGGGLSSLNKVCVVGPPSRPDADVDYTFVQLGVDEPVVDYGGNCGNMSSAIGPYALEEGIVSAAVLNAAGDEAVVRIHNTNTGKIIVARFPVADGLLAVDGDFHLDGVAGTAAPIKLEFVEPGGARTGRLLPTGAPRDRLDIPGLGPIEASCIDAANPCVFVRASDLGLTGVELPTTLEADPVCLERMEAIRQSASVAMGLADSPAAARALASIPKVAMLAAPQPSQTLTGRTLAAHAMDIAVRMISVGQPHRAVPITGAVCLAVATRVPGSIAAELCTGSKGPIRIGHASGSILVDANVVDGKALDGAVFRSVRRLFEGSVVYRARVAQS